MPWTDEPGGGFTTPGATPWLPFGDLAACNVAAQREDPGSTLHLVRDLIALRSGAPRPDRRRLRDAAGAGRRVGVAARRRLRGRAEPVGRRRSTWTAPAGRVAIGTDRARDGEAVGGALALGPWEGVVVALA